MKPVISPRWSGTRSLKGFSGRLQVFFLSAVVAAASLCLQAATAAAFVDRGQTLSRVLPNGMEVLVREEPAFQVVEVQIWVGAGSRDEPPGKEGVAHLFEHMIFKGTEKYGVGEIARAVEASGGDINAYTSQENTVYHITIAAEHFPIALAILADAVLKPVFNPGELEKEKLVVIEEIHRGEDDPSRVFSRELFKNAFRVHPYGRTVIGTPESVSGISRRDMIRFHRDWYVPGNMKLVVVGGVKAADVFNAAGELFTGSEPTGKKRAGSVEPPQEDVRTFRLLLDSEPARMALAFPIGDLKDPETPVLDLIAALLSGGRSSRLPVNLRDSGLVHSAWAYAYTPTDPGLFVIGATMSREKSRDAFKGVLAQMTRLQLEPVTHEELDRARQRIISDKIFSRETVEGQARDIGYLAMNLGDLDFNDQYYSRLQSVDSRDIMEVSRRVFRPERATVGFLSPDEKDQPDDEMITRA
ncbi:MAG: insulinase family protein, partial [Proteobacteria bacterium]|nr:insulinase family protein [Pseudomonadota bacterium]